MSADGGQLTTMHDLVYEVLRNAALPELLGDATSNDDGFQLQVDLSALRDVAGSPLELYLRWPEHDSGTVLRILRLDIVGPASAGVAEVALTRGSLGDVPFAHGEGEINGARVQLVVAKRSNEEVAVVRLSPPPALGKGSKSG